MGGKTLWQKWTERAPESIEGQYYNPLEAKIGTALSLDILDHRDIHYTVNEIHEYERKIDGKSFKFCDYFLSDGVVLRVYGPDEPGEDVTCLLLQTWYEEDGFGGVPDGETGQMIIAACRGTDDGDPKVFQRREGDTVVEEYQRIGGRTAPQQASMSILKDENGDGAVTAGEVERINVEIFDYERETKNEAGGAYTQYLFVQYETKNKYLRLLSGEIVNPANVSIF